MRRFLTRPRPIHRVSRIGLVLVVAALAPHGPAPTAKVVAQRGEECPCICWGESVAAPNALLLGETTEVSVHTNCLCAGEVYPVHIALVLDASGVMAGAPQAEQRSAAIGLVRALELRDNPKIQVGLVEFSGDARTTVALTNSEARVITAINRTGATGPQAVEAGIEEGARLLTRVPVRSVWLPDSSPHRVLVLMSAGPSGSCDAALRAAGKAKNQQVQIAAVCVGANCNSSCMQRLASNGRSYGTAAKMSRIFVFLQSVRDTIRNVKMASLYVDFQLPDTIRLVPGSAVPEPIEEDPRNRTITWQAPSVEARPDFTVTLHAEPLVAGHVPLAQKIVYYGYDTEHRTIRAPIVAPWALVLRPDRLATPRRGLATPTATSVPTKAVPPTRTVPPTVLPSDTPVPAPGYPGPGRRPSAHTMYLPLAIVGL